MLLDKKSLKRSETIFTLLLCFSLDAGRALAAGSNRQDELTRLVRQDCGSCHGMTLKGGLGKPLLPESLVDLDAQDVARVSLDGIHGTPMPPWHGILSD